MSLKKEVNVVIVEDNEYYNKVLTKYVSTICNEKANPGLTFNIKSYHNAHNAIEELKDNTDVMLLDYYLENEDEADELTGAHVLDEVNKHCEDCKVIMISEQDNPVITDELKEKGITEYIDKNISSKNRVGAILQDVINKLK